MQCHTVRSLACFVGMSWGFDSEFQTERALPMKAFADNASATNIKYFFEN